MATIPPGRSFSSADLTAMRAIYRRCCEDLGLGGGPGHQHEALARAIMLRYAAGSTDPERLAAQALKAARKAAQRPRGLWAAMMTVFMRLQPGAGRA